jgi:integrase
MQKKSQRKEILPLFDKFIRESKKGIRINKNGKRLSTSTIKNYQSTYRFLALLNSKDDTPITISTQFKLNRAVYLKEKKYWNNFFLNFKKTMYNNGCTDNYVGMCIKVLKTFFKYLELEENYTSASFYRQFYSPNFENQITVIDQEKLRFLIGDEEFTNYLPSHLKPAKDLLVVGCTLGLRFSDLISLNAKNIQSVDGNVYVVTKSQKTGVNTRIKIPYYVVDILNKYKKGNTILPKISLSEFNKKIKVIGELAGWTYLVGRERSINGVSKELKTAKGNQYRFCDILCSHIMRRTAITTLLVLGMPETLVRKISGHAANSKEFFKYVKYSEAFLDNETDKAFDKLINAI